MGVYAVEKSMYREDIENMLVNKVPLRQISSWLSDRGCPITPKAINNYKNNKFNVTVEASRKYVEMKSRERLDNASDDVVADLNKIDSILENINPDVLNGMEDKDKAKLIPALLNAKYKILSVVSDKNKVQVTLNIDYDYLDEVMDDDPDSDVIDV